MAALPDVSFVLDHVAKPNLREPDLEGFFAQLRPVAELPNVACKLSGLVTEAPWDAWTPELLRPYIERTVELFGVDRILFGSDWPVCLLAGTYAEVHGVVEEFFRGFSASERAKLFGQNAAQLYGIRA
jgi:L-fuconolactonase